MKIKGDSYLPLAALKGALLTNENGAEFRIHEFTVQLDDVTNVLVSLKEYDEDGKLDPGSSCAVPLSSIESWTIQLEGETA
tara:strand:- start:371 stop:613 length:243 start_codon:yes stop_codon:yes gene_type:complete